MQATNVATIFRHQSLYIQSQAGRNNATTCAFKDLCDGTYAQWAASMCMCMIP